MKLNRLMHLLLALLLALPACAEYSSPQLPGIPYADEDRLNEAANIPGGTLAFSNPEDPLVWPMLPAEEDGVACLTSTNWGVDDSVAAVFAHVEAQVGDVLSFTYKTSTETGFDLLQLCIDGEVVKVFTGEGDWARYAFAFPAAGEYEVSFRYSKDTVAAAGSDAVYIRDVALLTGAAAQAALAQNPVYPVSVMRSLHVATPGAREILFDDPTFSLTGLYGLARYYIVPETELTLYATLPAGADPDGEVLTVSGDSTVTYLVADAAADDGYVFRVPMNGSVAHVQLQPARDCDVMDMRAVLCFAGEEQADAFLQMMQGSGYRIQGWNYTGQMACAMTVIDQHGEFVEGVTLSIRMADDMWQLTADTEGTAAFAMADDADAEVCIVDAPDGYAFDAERIWKVNAENPEIIIDLTRIEE